MSWQEIYKSKLVSAEEAIKAIKAGEFVESLVDPSKTDSYIQRLEKIKRQGNGIE